MTARVLYIMGWQRSGTTILGNALGSAENVIHVGELNYLGHPDNPGECGCGRPFAECPIWSVVPEKLSFDLQDWHRDREETHRLKRLPRQAARWRRGQPAPPYAVCTAELYRTISEVSGCDLVIDSTKSPASALAALQGSDVEALILHIVRDPRAVAYSLAKRKKRHGVDGRLHAMRNRSEFEAGLRWTAANGAAEAFIRPLVPSRRYLRVRYEDLMSTPRATLEHVAAWAGIAPDSLPFTSDRAIDLTASHTVMGNPDRFSSGSTMLTLDSEWESGLSPIERGMAMATAWPLALRYGYLVGRRSRG